MAQATTDEHDLRPLIGRAADLIACHPALLTKSEVAAKIGGRRQWALAAVERLTAEGFATTERDDRGYAVYVPASSGGTPQRGREPGFGGRREQTRNPGSGRASGQTACAGPANDREVPLTTGNGNDPAPVTEPRCRCCRRADLRERVNRMLANGFSLRAIFESLAEVNGGLVPNRRITMDSLETHRRKHFPLQAGASAVWRRLLEERAAAESATYAEGVINLVTPRAYLEVMLAKSFAGLADEAAEVGVDQGLAAARELGKLVAQDDDEQKWARAHAQMARILAAFRELPDEYQQMVLDKVEGRTPVPPGGGRLALVEGGLADGDDEFDPLGEDDENLDDDD